MNKFWWMKFFNWMFTGKWQELYCDGCAKGIHMHDDIKTKQCITKGCDCRTEEE